MVISMTSEEKEKTITVRNVDKETYEQLVKLAKELGVKSGEMLSQAIKNFIATIEYGVTLPTTVSKELGKQISKLGEKMSINTISNIERLQVSAADLEQVKGKVLFRNIKELVIERDVTLELFKSKVAGIVFVNKLVIPTTLPKLVVLQKARFIKEIQVETLSEADKAE